MPPFEILFDKEKHRYTDKAGELAATTDVIGTAGFFQKSQYKYGSAERGHDLHSLFQFYDDGTLDWGTIADEYMPYLKQYDLAMKEAGVVWTEHEQIIGHHLFRYAGTIDKIGGRYLIGEIKTGRKEKWHRLQVAAYWKGLEWFRDAEIKKALLIYVHAEDHEVIEITDISAEWQVFMACLEIYRWRKG